MTILPWKRAHDGPLRLRPQDGEPTCFLEQFSQHVWTHKLEWYIAVFVTATLALVLLPAFGVEVSLR